jgi:hypothetical protein
LKEYFAITVLVRLMSVSKSHAYLQETSSAHLPNLSWE